MSGTPERSSLPALSRDDILNLVGPVFFEQGLDYYHGGMVENALSAARDYFRENPSTSTLDLFLSHTPEEKRQTAREEALGCVLTIGRLSSAIEICLRERERPRLAQALYARQEELLKLDYYILAPLAKELEADFPGMAILIYRKLALDILEEKRSRAYHHAIGYLRQVKKLVTGSGRQSGRGCVRRSRRDMVESIPSCSSSLSYDFPSEFQFQAMSLDHKGYPEALLCR